MEKTDVKKVAASYKLRLRSFVSWATAACFAAMFASGVVVYLFPYFAGNKPWRVLGLPTGRWMDVHIVTGFLFVPLSLTHLILNLRPFLSYLKKAGERAGSTRREAAAAVVLVALVAAATAAGMKPFSSFVEFGREVRAFLKQRAAAEEERPRETAPTPSPSPDTAAAPSPSPTPPDKYAAPVDCRGKEGCGRGLATGKLTLREFCSRYRISLRCALAKLKKRGIEATPRSRIRRLADELGVIPLALVCFLKRP